MWAVVEALQRQEELRGGPMRAPDEVAAVGNSAEGFRTGRSLAA